MSPAPHATSGYTSNYIDALFNTAATVENVVIIRRAEAVKSYLSPGSFHPNSPAAVLPTGRPVF
ncbi:hypothetical protein [Pyrobaculum aerophilum]|uniref:hypothetical protein n=1 Tax=Pyrobaculum aerophilum TaxID=13773 RepID=UPI002FDA683C